MGLSAIECLHRGVLNARANWELVLVHWVQFLVLAGVTLLGLLPPLLVLGLDEGLAAAQSDPDDVEALLGMIRELLPTAEQIAPLIAALGLAIVIWTVGFIAFCFLQGGILARGVQVVPEFVVFQTPPEPTATYHVLVSSG